MKYVTDHDSEHFILILSKRKKKKQTTCNAIIRLLLRRHILNYEAKMAYEDEKDIHITNNQEKQMKTTVQHQFANV